MSNQCVTLKDFISSIRIFLSDNDVDCLHWPDEYIIEYINDGVSMLLSSDPTIFSSDVVLELSPGTCQTLPDTYLEVVKIKNNISLDNTGKEIDAGSVIESSYDLLVSFSKASCNSTGGQDKNNSSLVSSFGVHTTNKKQFSVSPAIPSGSVGLVKATVILRPCVYTASDISECIDIDLRYHAALREWVLYRALTSDYESNRNTELGLAHARNFYSMMGLTYLQESRLNSGYYKGEPGDNKSLSYRWNR